MATIWPSNPIGTGSSTRLGMGTSSTFASISWWSVLTTSSSTIPLSSSTTTNLGGSGLDDLLDDRGIRSWLFRKFRKEEESLVWPRGIFSFARGHFVLNQGKPFNRFADRIGSCPWRVGLVLLLLEDVLVVSDLPPPLPPPSRTVPTPSGH